MGPIPGKRTTEAFMTPKEAHRFVAPEPRQAEESNLFLETRIGTGRYATENEHVPPKLFQ